KAVNGALPQIADFINTIDIGRYSEVSTTTSMSVCATSSHDGTDPLRSLSRLIFGRTWLPLLCYLPAARETVVLPISTSHSQGSMMKRLRSRIGPDRSSTRESAMSRFHLIAMLVAVAIGVAPAQAQDQFPTKPIRIVLPVPAGSALDVATHAIADELTARWGQQVLVEARPGAGGLIAGQAVATAAPDGYTLVGGPASLFTILPAQKDKLPIDVNKDFAHIGMIVGSAVFCRLAQTRHLDVSRIRGAGQAKTRTDRGGHQRRRHAAAFRRPRAGEEGKRADHGGALSPRGYDGGCLRHPGR